MQDMAKPLIIKDATAAGFMAFLQGSTQVECCRGLGFRVLGV